jgi:predicted nuclease of predicted toxin-antitoxin system
VAGPPVPLRHLLVDENLPRELTARLGKAGYEAEHVYQVGLRGRPDDEIFAYAQQHGQIILTSDVGFGNVLQYPPPHAGIIVARLPDTLTISRRLDVILDGLETLAAEQLENAVATIEVGRVRVHR